MDEFFTVVAWMGLILSAFMASVYYYLCRKYDMVIRTLSPVELAVLLERSPFDFSRDGLLKASENYFYYAMFFAAMLWVKYSLF